MNINTLLLAVAIWPGQTAHQLADRLGLRTTHGGRRQPYTYGVNKHLRQLADEGYVYFRDEPGGRGRQGWHRTWYAA